jgi:hypothetical protein
MRRWGFGCALSFSASVLGNDQFGTGTFRFIYASDGWTRHNEPFRLRPAADSY